MIASKADRQRRQYLIEGSFADAANNHGVQAGALAAIVAATDTGLSDRGHPEHPDFAGADSTATRRQQWD